MSKIRILSEQLTNQIAAGEVVERPASVVKELVENSIDAGASEIVVEVEDGGTGLLRVRDDGEGMDADDVLLALERHATSKLRDAEGLAAITTLGFRGEALPSIASVSRFVMVSRPRQTEVGVRAEQRFGRMQGCHEVGAPKGTMVEVRDLFGNVPARRKFLKSRRTEMFRIEEVLRDQALAHPEITFAFVVEGRPVWRLDGVDDPARRLSEVLRYEGLLLPLTAPTSDHEQGPICEGWLLEPDAPGGQARQLYMLVNYRPVRNLFLQRTVAEAMSGFLLQGRQPAGLLRLQLPLEAVDVNVHPAKREVRFRDLGGVRATVAAAVRRGLVWYQDRQRSTFFSSSESVAQAWDSPPVGEDDRQEHAGYRQPVNRPLISPDNLQEEEPGQPLRSSEPCAPSFVAPSVAAGSAGRYPVVQTARGPLASLPAAVPGTSTTLTPLAQLFDLYLLCADGEHLVVIDQHAAHERIVYEKLREGHAGRSLASQQLLHPRTLELAPRELECLERHREILMSLGFHLAAFGEDTVLIEALPALLSAENPEGLVRDVLESLRLAPVADAGSLPGAAFTELFSRLACRAAIKSGARLSLTEMQDLLTRMEASNAFSHCPHGRPVARRFSRAEIEKWFHRT